ncbi:aspartate/glutamate racemase family protein [Streptomyces sp. NPDC058045]|uniref:aspartate/glutamate racemase family protein n=1 Tax=Streptomyces sp. NPDC058045 TaxID=3346311 RepID=UPI0036F063E5
MTKRIWFQKHTVEGRLPLLDTWYREHLKQLVGSDTEVDIHTLPRAAYPAAIPEGVVRFGAVETFFSTYFSRQALAAEAQGYDAFVIATSQDPGLREARTLAGIPVLGYGETAYHFAAMSGQRFAVVGFIPELAEPLRENITASGLAHRFVGFEYLADGAAVVGEALTGDPDRFRAAFTDSARQAIARGAQLLIPGEGLPNEILWHEGVTEIDGVPIVDADGLLVKAAELMIDLTRTGVFGRSTTGYWFRRPDPSFIDHLSGVFWAPDETGNSGAAGGS